MPTDVDDIEIEDVEEALLRAEELAEITGRKKTDIVADLLDDGKLNLSAGSDAEVKKDILDIAQEKAEKFKTLITTLIPVLALLLGVGAEGIGVLDVTGWGSDSMWEDDDPQNPSIYWGCTDYNADNYDPMATEDDGSCYYEPPCDSDWRWENVIIRDADLNGQGFNNDLQIEVDFRDWNWCDEHMQNGYFALVIEKNGEIIEQWQINDNFHDEYTISETRMDLQPGDYRVAVEYHREGSYWNGPSETVTMESPECDDDIVINQLVLSNNADDLNLYVEFQDNNGCGGEIEMKLTFYKNGEYTGNEYLASNNYKVSSEGQTYFNINQDDTDFMRDVEDGDWKVGFRWYLLGEDENCCDMTNTITVDEIPDPVPCDADIDNLQATVNDNELTVMFYIAQHEDTDCDNWDIEINLQPVDDNEGEEISHEHSISPTSNYYSYTFEDVPNGDWAAEVFLRQEETEIDDDITSWITVNYQEVCDINLYWHDIATNATHAILGYDLDCGYEDNDLDGYNVSVQFLVYEVGSENATNGSQPTAILWETKLHYIQGWVEDNHFITLTNFTESNNTHYDFYAYFIWVDSDGQSQMIEKKWINRELAA